MLFSCREENGRDESRPAEARDFSQTIDDIEGSRPGLVDGICGWSLLDIFGAAFQNEATVICGKAFPVEDESVQELTTSERHEHPTSYPVRLASSSPDTLLFGSIVGKFERTTEGVDCDADAQLGGRAHA